MPGMDSAASQLPFSNLGLADFRAAAAGQDSGSLLVHQNGALQAVRALEPPSWGTQVVAWLHEKLEVGDSHARDTVAQYDAQRQNAREVLDSFERVLQQRFGQVTRGASAIEGLRGALNIASINGEAVQRLDTDALSAGALRSAVQSNAFKTLESRLDKVQQGHVGANQTRLQQFLQASGVGSARPLKEAVAAFRHLEDRQTDVARDAMAVSRAISESHRQDVSRGANHRLGSERSFSRDNDPDLGTDARSAAERNRIRAMEASSPFAPARKNELNSAHVAHASRISQSQAQDDLMSSLCRTLFERSCASAPEYRNGLLNTGFMQGAWQDAQTRAERTFSVQDPVRLISEWSSRVPAGTAEGLEALITKALAPPEPVAHRAAQAAPRAINQASSAPRMPDQPSGHRQANLAEFLSDVSGLKSFQDLRGEIEREPNISDARVYDHFVKDILRMSAHPQQSELFAALQEKTSPDIWMSGARRSAQAVPSNSLADRVVSEATGLPLGSIPSMGLALDRCEVALEQQRAAPNDTNARAGLDQSIEDIKLAIANALLPAALDSPLNSTALVFGADAPSVKDRLESELDGLLNRVHEVVDDLEPEGVVALVHRLVSDARYADRQAAFNLFLKVYNEGRGGNEEARAQDRQRFLTALVESPVARAPQPGMISDAAPPSQAPRADVVLMTRLQTEANPAIQQSLRNQLAANEVLNAVGLQWKRMPGDQECAFHTLRDQLGARQSFAVGAAGTLVVPDSTKTAVLEYRNQLRQVLDEVIANAGLQDGRPVGTGPSSAQALYVAGATTSASKAALSEPGVALGVLEPLRDAVSRPYAAGGDGEPGHFLVESLRSGRPLVMLNYSNREQFGEGFGRVMLADPTSLSITEHEFNGSPSDSRAIAEFMSAFSAAHPGVQPIFAINNGRNHWDSVEPLPPQSPTVSSARGADSVGVSTPDVPGTDESVRPRRTEGVNDPESVPSNRQTVAAPSLTGSVVRGLSEVSRLTDAETFQQAVGHAPVENRIARAFGASANYLAVLQGLGEYQASLNRPVPGDAAGVSQRAEQMVDALNRLILSAERYIQQHQGDPRREQAISAMQTMQQQALNEMKLLNDVVVLARERPSAVQSMTWQGVMAGARYRLLDSVARFNDANLDRNTPVGVAGEGVMNTVLRARYGEGDTATALILKPVVYNEANEDVVMQQLQPAGIDPTAPNYSARNVAMSFVNDVLGLNVLVQSTFVLHEQRLHLGMSQADGRPARDSLPVPMSEEQRNFLTVKVPQLRHVVDEMSLDDFEGVFRRANLVFKAGREGLLQQLDALQRKQYDQAEVLLRDPSNWEAREVVNQLRNMSTLPSVRADLQRELSNLEWLDALSAQTDRHPGNYMVDVTDEGRVRITGIDNDLSFGRSYRLCPSPANGLSSLPRLIDEQLAQRWNQIDFARDVRPTLLTLLSGDEVRATESRFNQLREHAVSLVTQGRVIEHDGWQAARIDGESVDDFLRNAVVDGGRDVASYYGRDV